MKMIAAGSCAVLVALMMHGQGLNAAASCESLSSMTLPNTSITVAQMVPAGGFTLPAVGPPAVQLFSRLPAFCRVAATLTPSVDSDIKMEVWLPAASWNGKFQAVGNGGWAGTLSHGAGLGTSERLRECIYEYGTHGRKCGVAIGIVKRSSISRIEPSTRWQ